MQGLPLPSINLIVFSAVFVYIIRLYIDTRKAARSVQDHPGPRILISQATAIGNFVPHIRWISKGPNYFWINKYDDFKKYGWDIYASVSPWPKPYTLLVLADADAIKEVVSSRSRFPKPTYQYKVLAFYGENIVVTEHEQWKRYRKIVAPVFSDRNNRLVWDESMEVVLGMFEQKWKGQDKVAVDHVLDITLPIALHIISIAGFGQRISWEEDDVIPQGHQMAFKEALHVVSAGIILKLFFPSWMYRFSAKLRRSRLAFNELEKYMLEMVHDRKNSLQKEERYDLFSGLLDANEDGDITSGGKETLSDSELVGNVFIFLVAGHETTAHSLAFAFAMLALYPEEQEKLYKHIKSVIPDDRIPTYGEMPLLTYSLAVFYETLRMFPPVNIIPKYSAEDTVLNVGNRFGESKTIAVPAGTKITINPPGLHYNPRYWEDPHTFKPSRFLEDWPRDAFLAFSGGARACIGRKFAETEAVSIITIMVSRYRLKVKEEPEFALETFEERKARITASNLGITMTPVRVPLVFERR